MYSLLSALFPAKTLPLDPRRIVLARHCCIGDVVMATAALSALREHFPKAHITWAIGPWSAPAIARHPALDALLILDDDMPLRSPAAFLRLLRRLRAGDFDLAVSLVRSPLMSLAICLSGIPARAGLDSGGRGFGYNLRVPVDQAARQRESEIYTRVVSAIAGRDFQIPVNLPVLPEARESLSRRLSSENVRPPFIVAHPGGGANPGARVASKRYPPAQLAPLLNRVAGEAGASVILIGGPGDEAHVDAVAGGLTVETHRWAGALNFQEIGALAALALLYIGNDSGLTHLAAASGAKTVMLMGPTDPLRYAPHTEDSLALWKPTELPAGEGWSWERDGFSAEAGAARILEFLGG